MTTTEITNTQRATIAEHWNTTEKKYMRALQRVYNSTVSKDEKDTNCLCTRDARRIWIVGFREWAKSNDYHD